MRTLFAALQEVYYSKLVLQMFWSFPRWFAPSVGGSVLPDTPENLLLSGQFAKVGFLNVS